LNENISVLQMTEMVIWFKWLKNIRDLKMSLHSSQNSVALKWIKTYTVTFSNIISIKMECEILIIYQCTCITCTLKFDITQVAALLMNCKVDNFRPMQGFDLSNQKVFYPTAWYWQQKLSPKSSHVRE
jgi:hypothetical protein